MSWHNPFSLGQKHLGMHHPVSLVWWPHPPAWLPRWISTLQMLHLCHADLCGVMQMHVGVSPVFWGPWRVGRQRGGGGGYHKNALLCSAAPDQLLQSVSWRSLSAFINLWLSWSTAKINQDQVTLAQDPCQVARGFMEPASVNTALLQQRPRGPEELLWKTPSTATGSPALHLGTRLLVTSLGYFRENVVWCSPGLAKRTTEICWWVTKLAQRESRSLQQPARKMSTGAADLKSRGE